MPVLNFFDNIDKTFSTLFVVMVVCYLLYWLMRRFNRPMLLGGLLSGVVIANLHIPPQFFDIHSCSIMGDTGIVLFMMLLGNSIHRDFVLGARRRIVPIIAIGVFLPFIVGFCLTLLALKLGWVHSNNNLKPIYFAVIFALAFSMSALPLVSIFLEQTNLGNSKIGSLVLLNAMLNEIFFWLLLSLILVFSQNSVLLDSYESFFLLGYLLFIIFAAPKLVSFLVKKIKNEYVMLSFLICGCFLFAVLADIANLHQIVGGFLFGLMLPKHNQLIVNISLKLKELIYLLLLPVYFVTTGLNAGFSILTQPQIIYLALLVTVFVLLVRYFSALILGYMLKYSVKDSIFLGSLLNLRGVVEVALLNVGVEIGVLSKQNFSILVVTTIITTWIAITIALKRAKQIK